MGLLRTMKRGIVFASFVAAVGYFGDKYGAKDFIDERLLSHGQEIHESIGQDSQPFLKQEYYIAKEKVIGLAGTIEQIVGYK